MGSRRPGLPVFFEPGSSEQLTFGLLICFLTLGIFAFYRPNRDPRDDTLQFLCLVEVFIALLSTIVLRYDIAFPDAAVDTFLTLTLLTPPALAMWYEVQALLEDLGHGKRLRRVAHA